MADVAARLEAVVARLEALASTINVGGGDAGGAAPSGTAAPAAKFVEVYNEFLENEVAAFVKAAGSIPGVSELGINSMAETFYSEIGKTLTMAADCSKPDQKVLMEKMKPVMELFPKAEKAVFKRGKFNNHATAWKEMLQMVNFLFVPKPRGFVEDSYTLPDVYLNRILVAAKKMEGEEKTNNQAFVNTAKAIGVFFKDYVKKYHAAEIAWNKKGGDAKTWTPGAAATGGAAVPPPPAGIAGPPVGLAPPPAVISSDSPKKETSAGGMSAVFAEINKGSAQCESAEAGGATAAFKLKKPGLKPKAKKKVEKKTVKKVVKVKPPSCEFRRGTWWVEHMVEDKKVEGVELKHNVYVFNAQKCTITIPGKIKSITIQGCKRATIIFDQVISTFEVVDCESCKVFCREAVPSVAIDKSKGTQVNFSELAVENLPEIVTSNISETNIVLPGKTSKDDPIEIPLPEQYKTTISGTNGDWNTDTTMVSHSG
eukprot:jgi/Bigna1/85542/estExt_fgenesh1_pg.C_40325